MHSAPEYDELARRDLREAVAELDAAETSGEPARLSHAVHRILAAGENFMGIGLVTDIPDNLVFGRVKDPV